MCTMRESFPAEEISVKVAEVKHLSAFWKLQEREIEV